MATDGLYDPRNEHDACGVALVARLDGVATHEVVQQALVALVNLEHRGAAGADPDTGDGAGILVQLPDRFLREVADVELPAPGGYGVAMCFLPRDAARRAEVEALLESTVAEEGQTVLGWRDVPVDLDHVGRIAGASRPHIRQLFIGAGAGGPWSEDQDAFERKLYVIRRRVELAAGADFYASSCSSRTCVYKGMLVSRQLEGFYPDLGDPRMESALGLVHSRFSTNTFPSWELAHPFRVIAHNGEINTLKGNVNWMRARESRLASALFGDDLPKVLPVVTPGASDSATFDHVLELLMLAGRSLPHAVMMMVPEAHEGRTDLPDRLRAFYEFHASFMEPWDGPAAVCFTDGRIAGATLDRNGLRPGRWVETHDGLVVLGSEVGLLDIAPERVKRLGRLEPGQLFLVDLDLGRIVADDEIKAQVAARRPYREWVDAHRLRLHDLPAPATKVESAAEADDDERARDLRRLAFGYTQEDLRVLIAPMAEGGAEPIGSMGNDAALAVLSDQRPPLFAYFKQLFAQVTNPPIDPIREQVVMSLRTALGAEGNLLEEDPRHARRLVLEQPVLRTAELARLRAAGDDALTSQSVDITWPAAGGPAGLERRVQEVCQEAEAAVRGGAAVLVLSDRATGPDRAPIPSLLAVAAVHHHLVRAGIRLRCSLVVESGEPREVHHLATLIGFGASAVNPYLLLETAAGLAPGAGADAESRVVEALGKGLLKTMSKVGISTIQSYCGAQIFEAVGLASDVVDQHFCGTASRIGGIGIGVVAEEALARHARAYRQAGGASSRDLLPVGGMYAWRRDGEHHMWNPETIATLQHAVRDVGAAGRETYAEFARRVNEDATRRATLRGLLTFRDDVEAIPLDEVEPAQEIVKRFATGAMSLGSISRPAHETLARAMNRLGGRSNTGEGGEDPERFGDERRSAIKQVASGRFGVTIHYLVNADQLQIKMAQGAKPGEGGQLPGHKVDEYIGSVRHTTPGVGLISPPPHHDIYSIEDLKQLIYDLRCANPKAQVSVKLVSEVGVGTVAAGVAKANADHVVIAGHDGGTGASPLSSIVAAGAPWEIGLAETQQTLLKNDLRSRIVVQTDGQLKTGRDVAIAALLGADEFGFSTAPLIATGCIMMRACHLNTCPVGIATQDPELVARFRGRPEHVITYFLYVAEELREVMASLGIRKMEDMIGRVDLLQADQAIDHWKARGLDLAQLLTFPRDVPADAPRRQVDVQPPVLEDALDWELVARSAAAIEHGEPVTLDLAIANVDRCAGGILSSHIAARHGADGLAEGTIAVGFRGSAGQSFGGWLAPGVSFTLEGDANDYVGKGLSGGVLALRPPRAATYRAEDNVIAGNTVLYGATSGRAFFRGRVGERFAVRNSGALAVVEGVGDHGCEYMTGGCVVVLGRTGRNFAAGMSGGIAYVLDDDKRFAERCNPAARGDLNDLDEADVLELRDLVAEHVRRTDSPVGRGLLAESGALESRFVKVFPAEYRRVLEQRATEGPVAEEVR